MAFPRDTLEAKGRLEYLDAVSDAARMDKPETMLSENAIDRLLKQALAVGTDAACDLIARELQLEKAYAWEEDGIVLREANRAFLKGAFEEHECRTLRELWLGVNDPRYFSSYLHQDRGWVLRSSLAKRCATGTPPPRVLYHYTSVNGLALILQTGGIRFTRLDLLNDPEEGRTKAGNPEVDRSVYVTCWSVAARESLPLWTIYGHGMSGCRLELPWDMFGTGSFDSRGTWTIGLEGGGAEQGHWHGLRLYGPSRMVYSDEPRILEADTEVEGIAADPYDREDSPTSCYSLWPVGLAKRTHWAFEEEWRFRIMKSESVMEHHYGWGMEPPPGPRSPEAAKWRFASLRMHALSDLAVRLGPKASDAERVIVETLLQRFAPSGRLEVSELRVR